MPEPVGVAVVGAGFMGGVHADLLTADPRVDVRWVVDVDPAAGAELADRHCVPAATDLEEVLTDDAVQLVVVAVPAGLHEPIATRALLSGRHVLVEKPLVVRATDAVQLGNLASERGLVLAHGSNFLHAPKFSRARELVADRSALGEPVSARVVFRNAGPDSPWFRDRSLAGGGVLLDLGWHAVELCRWLLGKPAIAGVTACARQVRPTGNVEDQGLIWVHFADGTVGQCDLSWVCPGGEQVTVEVIGTDGIVCADLWQGMGISAYTNQKFAGVWEPDQGWIQPEWEWIRNSGYEHQDRAVVSAVLGTGELAHTPVDALVVARTLEAAYESLAQERRVELHD